MRGIFAEGAGGSRLNESVVRGIKSVPILVAGDVMVDEYILGEVSRISPESPVPVVVVRDRLRRLGGAGNVVTNLVSMGAEVGLFGTVGKDAAGRLFREFCEEMGAECFWLREDETRPTTIKTRVVARNQQIVRIDEERVEDISPTMEAALIRDVGSVVPQVKAVIISDYRKGFLTPRFLTALIGLAAEHNVPVLVDPKGRDFGKYRGVTYITPNLNEASLASGIEIRDRESLAAAGKALLDQTEAKGIIITRGREGSTLVTQRKVRDFPVSPVEIIDVTGAGDTVIAALALAVANGLPIESAVKLANLAASIVVSRFGSASVTLNEIADRLSHDGPETKLIGFSEIGSTIRNHRINGEKIVFTNGCFDLFHVGHLKTLHKASQLGQALVVGINSDKSVTRLKGPGRPIIPEHERVELVSALGFVDYVVLFDEDTPLRLIEEIRPDVLVKGEDWKGKEVVGADVVRARGGSVEFIRHVKGISTSDLINRIKNEG